MVARQTGSDWPWS